MKKFITRLLLGILMVVSSFSSFSQSLGLNNAAPNASSIMDMVATNRGLLIPRMTQAQRNLIGTPATSLLIFQTDATPGFYFYDGTVWRPLLTSNTGWIIGGNAPAGASILGTTNNSTVNLQTGTGALNLGADAFAKTITLGNITTTTAVNINTGTAGTTHTTTNGIYTLATGTGTVSINNDATNNTLNIGTGAGVKTLTLGSINTTSTTTINSGSNAVNINVNNNQPTNINTGSSTGAITMGGGGGGVGTTIFINHNLAGTFTTSIHGGNSQGTLSLGTGGVAKTVTLGNHTGATDNNIRSGTTGVLINDNSAVNSPVRIGTGTTTGQVSIGNITGKVIVGATTAPAEQLDVRGTIVGALPQVAISMIPYDYANGNDDEHTCMIIATRPSTNEIWMRVTTSAQTSANGLDAVGNYSAWTNFGSPTGAAGTPYIMSIGVQVQRVRDDSNQHSAVMTARMSNGTVYVRSTSNKNHSVANLINTASWGAWTSFTSPGM